MSKQKTAQQIAEEAILFKSKKYYTIEQMADTIEANSNALNKILNLPRLSIPKKIAEIADETWGYGDIDPLDIFGDVRLPDFENWWKSQDHPKDLIVAYLAGKALSVELVEVEG
ncbi:hypothetical protein [Lactococcus garvieae]|uniref:hypothetical protein n=1 Tax=Lactococcus garvieae TaxID=1363 RepID=UPI00254C46A0|nr:hypothetical protein [Lactococcus garvieae]